MSETIAITIQELQDLKMERDQYREKFFNEIKLRKHTFEILDSFFKLQSKIGFLFIHSDKEELKKSEKEMRIALNNLLTSKKNFEKRYNELDENLKRLQWVENEER